MSGARPAPDIVELSAGNHSRGGPVDSTMTTIGIVGAGLIGSQIARSAVKAGYDVVIGNSRGPETLASLIDELGPTARAATAAEAAAAGDFVVVAVPFKDYLGVPVAELADKVVIDTSNYDTDRDPRVDEIEDSLATVSGLMQSHLPSSRVVRGFNLIAWQDITTAGAAKGSPERRALAAASDYPDAIDLITRLYDEFGFDTVVSGKLSTSWRFDRDNPAYVVEPQSVDELTENLASATRRS